MMIWHAIPYSPCFRQNPLSLSSPFLPSRQGSNEPHESWYAITLCGMWYRSLALFLLPVLSKPPSSSFLTSLPFTSFSSSVLAFFSFACKSMSCNPTLTTQFKPEAVCQCWAAPCRSGRPRGWCGGLVGCQLVCSSPWYCVHVGLCYCLLVCIEYINTCSSPRTDLRGVALASTAVEVETRSGRGQGRRCHSFPAWECHRFRITLSAKGCSLQLVEIPVIFFRPVSERAGWNRWLWDDCTPTAASAQPFKKKSTIDFSSFIWNKLLKNKPASVLRLRSELPSRPRLARQALLCDTWWSRAITSIKTLHYICDF